MISPRFLCFYDYDDAIGGYRFFRMEDGDKAESAWGAQHEEGWSRRYMTWTREGNVIRCDWTTEGRDCDGYTRHDGTVWTTADRLAVRDVISDDATAYPFKLPEWNQGRVTCLDESAEAAGY